MSGIPPLDPFSFKACEWARWKGRFEQYILVKELSAKTDEVKISHLQYLMGPRAVELLNSLAPTSDQKTKYDPQLTLFDNHYKNKTNVLYERVLFNRRIQDQGESADSFIMAVHSLAGNCKFGAIQDELIRDRLIVGMRSISLSEKLMGDSSNDLTKVVAALRQHEEIQKQQPVIHLGTNSSHVDQIHQNDGGGSNYPKKKGKKGKGKPNNTGIGQTTPPNASSPGGGVPPMCFHCGGRPHSKFSCPAKDLTCNSCGRSGHFSKMCRTPKAGVRAVEEDDSPPNQASSDDSFFLDAIISSCTDGNAESSRWTAIVKVESIDIQFKLDSGADVTVLPEATFRETMPRQRLIKPTKNLYGAANYNLETLGMFSAALSHKSKTVTTDVYVVRGLATPLLGGTACEDLNLLQRICAVSTSLVCPRQEFPELFSGLGKFEEAYDIKLCPNAVSFSVLTPRRVPIPLMKGLKTILSDMVKNGVIRPVDEPTDWCAPMVLATKKSGDIRVCVDLSQLNKSVKREIHPMPVVEHTLGQLKGAKYFFKLDQNDGFWQVPLSKPSQLLTTFITPYGRYAFCRVPFGITSAPEHHQKKMQKLLTGIQNVTVHTDDILGWAATIKQHDTLLRQVLSRLRTARSTLNGPKCEWGVTEISFLGHKIDGDGIQPDERKIEAITKLRPPANVGEVRQLLGMVNYVGRFIPNLTAILAPLNELLKAKSAFLWGPAQNASFQQLKSILSSAPVLAIYDPDMKTVVSSDASSYGIGAVLLQQGSDGYFRPVAYASRTMTDTEKRYAQIEKEALALTWACERFEDFLTGLDFNVETDHKPLVPIFTSKLLDELTPRMQRFRMRMFRFRFGIYYTPGNQLVVADALSRNPLATTGDRNREEELEAYVQFVTSHLPIADRSLAEIQDAQQKDDTIQQVIRNSRAGWPPLLSLNTFARQYYSVRDELYMQGRFLMRGNRIVVPPLMRDEILGRIHSGHQGVSKCRARAKETVWWPGISSDIEEMVRRCRQCIKERTEHHEPLPPSTFPERPWQKIAMDLFKLNGHWYLLLTDYYSRYPFVTKLGNSLASEVIIRHCKSIFSVHGIPEEVRSDNGPQFEPTQTSEFRKFANDWGFTATTSSPQYPQSNGFVEVGVKTVKGLLKNSNDMNLALMAYRATPLANGYSPAQLLMGQRVRTTLPLMASQLQPRLVPAEDLQRNEKQRILQQKAYYDKRKGVVEKKTLDQGEIVWIKDQRRWGTVVKKETEPRSYTVKTSTGVLRRNAFYLTPTGSKPLSIREYSWGDHFEPRSELHSDETILPPVPDPEDNNDVIVAATGLEDITEVIPPADPIPGTIVVIPDPPTSGGSGRPRTNSASSTDEDSTVRRSTRERKAKVPAMHFEGDKPVINYTSKDAAAPPAAPSKGMKPPKPPLKK